MDGRSWSFHAAALIFFSLFLSKLTLDPRKVQEYPGGAYVSPLLLATRGGHTPVCKVTTITAYMRKNKRKRS